MLAEPLIGQKDTRQMLRQAPQRRNGRDWPVRYNKALPEVDKAEKTGVPIKLERQKIRGNANTGRQIQHVVTLVIGQAL